MGEPAVQEYGRDQVRSLCYGTPDADSNHNANHEYETVSDWPTYQ